MLDQILAAPILKYSKKNYFGAGSSIKIFKLVQNRTTATQKKDKNKLNFRERERERETDRRTDG